MSKTKNKLTYKVWTEIEEYNERTGSGETVDAPGAALMVFDTYEEAWAYAEKIEVMTECFDYLVQALQDCITKEGDNGMKEGLGRQKRRLLAINIIAGNALAKVKGVSP